MRRSILSLLVVVSTALASATPAHADEDKPLVAGTRAGAEMYWWSAKRVESAFPIIPFGQFELNENLVLGVHVPISFIVNAHVRGEDKALLSLGNPTVNLDYVSTNDKLTWFVGGRASAPLTGVSDEQTWLISNLYSAIAMGLWDLHYWAYKYLPIGARGGVEYATGKGLFVRGSLEPTLYIPLDSDRAGIVGGAGRKTQFFYQLHFELEGRSASGWGGGGAIQVVHLVTEGDALGKGDNAQGAFEPFVSYESPGLFGRLGCLIALDTPLGLGFDQGKVAALHLTLGSHL